jgi:hypothetical protein
VIPVVVLHAVAIAFSVEASWKESCALVAEEEPGAHEWPIGYCVEASIQLRDELDEKVPEAGAELVWGTFTVGVEAIVPLDHAWIELGGGWIIDLTLAQFFRSGEAPLLVRPDGPLFERYTAVERTPSWAESWQDSDLVAEAR